MKNIILEIKAMLAPAEKHVEDYKAGWHECLKELQAEYDALCPKPSEFMFGYEWYTIDHDGSPYWSKEKPEITKHGMMYMSWGAPESIYGRGDVTIPLGLDWRLCCWSIEDAKRIWGE